MNEEPVTTATPADTTAGVEIIGYAVGYELTPGDGTAPVNCLDFYAQVQSREDADRECARQQGHEEVEARHAAPEHAAGADKRAYFVVELRRVPTA
jgi:hypothetical protein